MATEPVKVWTKLLGSSGTEWANALTTGLDGSIYVAGYTSGALDGQTNNGGLNDAYLTKYSSDGTKAWTKLLGTSVTDEATALTTGLDGSIYVAGYTAGALDGQTNSGGDDVFLAKYTAEGTKVWTKLLGTGFTDAAYALSTGIDGSIYVGGYTNGSLDGQTYSGSNDAFLTKYSADGTKVWTKLLGSSGTDWANALTTGLDGSIYVAGYTSGALDGQTNSGLNDIYLTKYSSDGAKVWTKVLGTSVQDMASALTTGLDGAIYVAGYTAGALDGQTNSGLNDAFLTKYSTDGTKAWTKLLGSSGADIAYALTTGLDGSIYVGGYATGALDGQTYSGGYDAFLAKYSADGAKVWTKLLGSSGTEWANALTTGLDGAIYIAGFNDGSLDGQTNSGGYDAFLVKYQDVTATPTYTLSASSTSVNEGSTATFTLTTTNVTSGTSVPYTLSGVSAADITGGLLTGSATVNSSGVATISVGIVADSLTEGAETLTITAGGSSASTGVNDTSIAAGAYQLNGYSTSVNEGGFAEFTLYTKNVAIGTVINYSISGTGITSSDIVGGSLSGTSVVASTSFNGFTGGATIYIYIAEDSLTEGAESLEIYSQGKSSNIAIKDTSKSPTYSLQAATSEVDPENGTAV